MKNKKGLIVGIVIAIVLLGTIVSVISYKMLGQIRHKREMGRLMQELNEVDRILSSENFEADDTEEVMGRTVTKGQYAEVERAIKAHGKEMISMSDEIVKYYDDQIIENFLTPEMMQADAPAFTNTIQKLTEFKEKQNNYLESWKSLISEEGVRKYQKTNFGKDLQKVFDHYVDKIAALGVEEEMEDTIDYSNNTVDVMLEALNYLKDNQSAWTIEDGQIAFYSEEAMNTYQAIVDKFQEDYSE